MKWTGWPGEAVKRTPVGELLYAIEARVAFLEATTVGAKPKRDAPSKEPAPKDRSEFNRRAREAAGRIRESLRR